MKHLLFFIFVCLFSVLYGQKKYSVNEMVHTFPFSKASKIKIISYNTDFISETPLPLPPIGGKIDSVEIKRIIANRKFPIKLENILGKENPDGEYQIKTLSYEESFGLLKILYNTCGKFSNDIREVSKCFFPRNAVLFFDENDKVFEILEICFECKRIEFHSKKSVEINGICNNFYPKLESLFQFKNLPTRYKGK